MASLRKKIVLWMINKYFGPYTCVVVGASQDHLRLDSDMISEIILSIVKMSPRISIPMLTVNIRSQYKYTPTYYKAWVTKQKAMDKFHHVWENLYNYLWKCCQVLDRYIPGSTTDLKTYYAYFSDQLPNICVILDRRPKILFVIELHGSPWDCTHHQYYLRYVRHMMSNLAECINSVLEGIRHLPVTLIVKETYFFLATLFLKRVTAYAGQIAGSSTGYDDILKEI
ncbi:hypothetical protein PVK06_009267 [Gossypium arboreum]|uniref:Uncharacterized protein n=1 Tax=Gossypium arboreum TaxID=29729 RepID=A0ABR0QLY3_GOSAR|nr:hypothetical protein PVK06_009267 [Gossypium arboreum]